MSVDPRTLGWLSRALTHEMSAGQQYLAQSVLSRLWGDEALSSKLRSEAGDLQLRASIAHIFFTTAGGEQRQLFAVQRRIGFR